MSSSPSSSVLLLLALTASSGIEQGKCVRFKRYFYINLKALHCFSAAGLSSSLSQILDDRHRSPNSYINKQNGLLTYLASGVACIASLGKQIGSSIALLSVALFESWPHRVLEHNTYVPPYLCTGRVNFKGRSCVNLANLTSIPQLQLQFSRLVFSRRWKPQRYI